MRVYLSLGSNLGNRHEQLLQAIRIIEERIGRVTDRSALIETEPWGFHSTHRFVNAVIAVETDMTAHTLLVATQDIERELGRVSKTDDEGYHDRAIDIDILLYGEETVDEPSLRIPHPLMTQRMFVIQPLWQIAPHQTIPGKEMTVGEIYEKLREMENT